MNIFFDYDKDTETELINKIDLADVINLLKTSLGEQAMEDLDTMVAGVIRNPKTLKDMCAKLGCTKLEFLSHCVKLAPDIFKYHLLRFIKENYNFELDD